MRPEYLATSSWLSTGEPSTDMTVTYMNSNAISSTVLFKVSFSSEASGLESEEPTQYPMFMVAKRNNEIALYNSDYLNYTRVGYNYDIKNMTWSNGASWATAALSALGLLTTLAAGGAGGLASASFLGTAASFANAVRTTTENRRTLDERLRELANKPTSVTDADDVYLLNQYGNNHVWLYAYGPRPDKAKTLKDHFRFFGYSVNDYGVPNPYTRQLWDYIQADIDFDESRYPFNQMNADMRAEWLADYSDGVTVFHPAASALGAPYWDLGQADENDIETSVLAAFEEYNS
jgi:hypothetical protein